MANAASAQTAIPIGYSATLGGVKTTPVIVTFDTTASDLTVYTPAATKYWAIAGLSYCEGDAHSLIIKSGSTTLTTYEFAANSGPAFKLGDGIVLTGLTVGGTLVLRTATANPVPFTIYVQEFTDLRLV